MEAEGGKRKGKGLGLRVLQFTDLLGSTGLGTLGAGGFRGAFGLFLGCRVFRGVVVVVVFEVAFVVVVDLLARFPHALLRRGSVRRDRGIILLAFGDVHEVGKYVAGVHD